MAPEVIETFIRLYLREMDYSREAARLCPTRCEEILQENGVRALTTYREKRPASLGDKREARDAETAFTSLSELYTRVVDLPGVRLALYFAGDLPKVDRLLEDSFDCLPCVVHPRSRTSSQAPGATIARQPASLSPTFVGYVAHHAKLRDDDLPRDHKRLATPTIEIQVATVLTHALV